LKKVSAFLRIVAGLAEGAVHRGVLKRKSYMNKKESKMKKGCKLKRLQRKKKSLRPKH